MVKYVSTFRLKPGIDPDEAVKLWHEAHIPRVLEAKKKCYDIKRYVISRILSAPEAKPDFFGMAEQWFDDLDSAKKYMGYFLSQPPDAFSQCITDARRLFVVEEQEIEL